MAQYKGNDRCFSFFHEEYNIATIYQHHLNELESLTLVSMRAVYPENCYPIGSVQKKWQAFVSFHEENFGVDLATKKQHLCTIYPAHFLSDFRESTLLCYSIKVFWVKPSGEPQGGQYVAKDRIQHSHILSTLEKKKCFGIPAHELNIALNFQPEIRNTQRIRFNSVTWPIFDV